MKTKQASTLFRWIIMCFAIGWMFPSSAAACDCEAPQEPEEAEEFAAAVFSGEVIDTAMVELGEEELEAALIEVTSTWKGIEETQALVYTDTAQCRFPFNEGEEYLLYPVDFNGDFHVYECFAGGPLEESEEDLEFLGEGSPPENEVALEDDLEEGGFSMTEGVIIIVIGGAALLGVFFVGRKLLLRK